MTPTVIFLLGMASAFALIAVAFMLIAVVSVEVEQRRLRKP